MRCAVFIPRSGHILNTLWSKLVRWSLIATRRIILPRLSRAPLTLPVWFLELKHLRTRCFRYSTGKNQLKCNRTSLRSSRYCVVVEWDLAAKPPRARNGTSSPLPFLDHGSAAKILITHQDNTPSYAGYKRTDILPQFLRSRILPWDQALLICIILFDEQPFFEVIIFFQHVLSVTEYLYQGRLFSYHDTHLHRLGTNYLQLPVNCPYKTRVCNYQRDGPQTFDNQSKSSIGCKDVTYALLYSSVDGVPGCRVQDPAGPDPSSVLSWIARGTLETEREECDRRECEGTAH